MEYLPTFGWFLIVKYGKCRQIYHTWMLWVLNHWMGLTIKNVCATYWDPFFASATPPVKLPVSCFARLFFSQKLSCWVSSVGLSTFNWCKLLPRECTVDGSEIRQAPVDMADIPVFTKFYIYLNWLAGFLPSTVSLTNRAFFWTCCTFFKHSRGGSSSGQRKRWFHHAISETNPGSQN